MKTLCASPAGSLPQGSDGDSSEGQRWQARLTPKSFRQVHPYLQLHQVACPLSRRESNGSAFELRVKSSEPEFDSFEIRLNGSGRNLLLSVPARRMIFACGVRFIHFMSTSVDGGASGSAAEVSMACA